jgi:hypothetical protein
MPDSLQAGDVSILVGRRTLPQTKYFWAPTRKVAHQTTLKHVMSACRTQRAALARRPAQLRRQASRFTMLRLLALALCGEVVLQSLTTTVAESGSCEQPALFAFVLHGHLPRARDIAVVVSVSGPAWTLVGIHLGISTLETALL